MEASLQTRPRRARRPWTDEDQSRAEKLRAQGLSYCAIGREMARSAWVVQCRLDPVAREAMSESRRRWDEQNPGKTAEAIRRWGDANRDRTREMARRRYQSNHQAELEKLHRWRAANREHMREYSRRWRQENKKARCEQERRRRALKLSVVQSLMAPVTVAQIQERFALFGDCCAYCGNPGRMTVDHVLALTAGGLDVAENIAPACLPCNSGKRDRPVDEWFRRQSFFSDVRWRKLREHCPDAVTGQLPLAPGMAQPGKKKEVNTLKGSTTANGGSEPGTGGEATQAV